MLNGTSHHPEGRKRWSHQASFVPIPSKAKLSSRNEQKMYGAMAWGTPRDQIQHPKNPSLFVWAIRQIPTHHTKPDPDNMQRKINPNWTVQQIKNHWSVSQWHLTRPNRPDNSCPKGTKRRCRHIGVYLPRTNPLNVARTLGRLPDRVSLHSLHLLCSGHHLPCGRNRRALKPLRTRKNEEYCPVAKHNPLTRTYTGSLLPFPSPTKVLTNEPRFLKTTLSPRSPRCE